MRTELGGTSIRVAVAISVLLPTVATRPASAAWPPFGRGIVTAATAQVHPSIASDGADGAIITWQDFRFPRVNIFAQHVQASGELDPVWPTDGLALLTDPLAMAGADGGQNSPVIVPDGAGGAIVAWQDNRSAVTETDIFAQHVLASGEVDSDWKANGAALCSIEGLQNNLAIVSDGAGGAIVTWMDSRPGTSVKDIFAQHVLATGIVDERWPENGLAVCNAPGLQEFPAIVADGAGGAIITWDDQRSVTTGDDVYAQHVLNSGIVDRGWPVNGQALCLASGDQGRPSIASDGALGAIVAWSDSRVVGTSHIFANHVLAAGAVDPAWPVNGRGISGTDVLESRPLTIADGAGGAVVAWQGFTIHLNMFAQHITASGVVDPVWPAGGRALSNVARQESHAEAVSDGAGGAVVAWEDSGDVVAQHVRATGTLDPAYPDSFRTLSNLPSAAGDVALVATGGGGAIATWTDGRNVTSPDIFALQVLEAGTVSVPNAIAAAVDFARPIPNPTRGRVALRFALPRQARAQLAIYDVSGRRVRELVSGAQPAGDRSISWDLRDEAGRAVGAGLYFARLETEGRVLTQRLVTLR